MASIFVYRKQPSEEHDARVAELSRSLRSAGFSVTSSEDAPAPGKPEKEAWLHDQLQRSSWVICVDRAARDDAAAADGKFLPVMLKGDAGKESKNAYRLPDDLLKLIAALATPPAASTAASTPTRRRKSGGSKPPKAAAWPEILPYGGLSLGGFLAAFILIWLMLSNAERLAGLSLFGNFYYIALVPLGLAVAAFLFGALRSYARYTGKHFGGALELGGPVVAFVLTLVLGFLLPSPASNFPFTVFVQGGDGEQEIPLRGRGSVMLDLGAERRRQRIAENGQAVFSEIPASFRGQIVKVSIDAEGYELAQPGAQRLEGSSLYLAVRKKPWQLSGRVQDEDDGTPVAGATVTISNLSTTTNEAGHFTMTISGQDLRDGLWMQVDASGYEAYREPLVPYANEPAAVIRKVAR